jgi:hypothetical protein
VEIYRCLVGAGLLDEAAVFFSVDLARTLLGHIGANTLIVELVTPLFRGGRDGLPFLTSAADRSYILNSLAAAWYYLGRDGEAQALFAKSVRIDLEEGHWRSATTHLRNIAAGKPNRGAESAAAVALALDLATAASDDHGVNKAVFLQAQAAIEQGRHTDGKRMLCDFQTSLLPPIYMYVPGEAERWFCLSRFYQGTLTESDYQRGYELAAQHRNVVSQYQFLALRSEWLLTQDQTGSALDAIDEALKVANRLGTPHPEYHDLRGWALAKLSRADDARAELANGQQRRFATEAWLILGEREQARTCALNGYRWAWGEGPPYIHWYELERSRALLRELGEPEPQLPPFDPSKVKPIPYEAEIRAAIAKLKAEKEARAKKDTQA